MPKDRYSEEEVERILKNAIRADSSLLASPGFSADDVRRIAGELGLDSSKLEFGEVQLTPEVTKFVGFVTRVNFKARIAGNPELIFERALSVLHSQYRLVPQISARPRGREMVNILPDTRSRLSVIDEENGVTLEYLRDFSTINLGPMVVICVILPIALAVAVIAANLQIAIGFTLWLILSAAVMTASMVLSQRYLRQEKALWGRILAACRAD
jgi:hypothetical protein